MSTSSVLVSLIKLFLQHWADVLVNNRQECYKVTVTLGFITYSGISSEEMRRTFFRRETSLEKVATCQSVLKDKICHCWLCCRPAGG